MSSSLRPNSERHGWQISTMAPPRIKSAMISRGTCGIEAFFSCSPVRSASLTASRLRNTATGCPVFSMAWANSSPVAPRQESPVVMWSKSGWFSGLAKAPVRSSWALPGGTDAISPPPRRKPSRKMTIRCMGMTSLQHVGSVGLLVLSPESAEGSMARPLTRSRRHRSIACKTRGPRCSARRRGLRMIRLLLIALASAMVAASAIAQTSDEGWPERPIRLVVPFPAGSSTDIIARIVAQKLSPRLGQQIVIENRAGASGNIGADAVAKAAPDGYTIGIATASTHAVAASLNANLPYDPIKDFAPVAMIGSQPYVLVLHPALPARNLAELIALAKAKPGTLNYGSAGVASLAHLATALFASMAGVNIVHVPYKSSSQSMTDMITGRLDMQFATIAPSLPNIRAGQLRALATSGKTRVAALPELPTVAEAGLAGYEAALWVSFVMPSAAPPTIIARLNREANDILKSTEGTEALVAQGMAAEPGPPEALTERIRGDIEKWRGVAVKAGIRPE